jgi:hypothetical protein
VSVIPEIERQLRDAAERMAQSPMSRAAATVRRWRGQLLGRPLLVGVLLVSSASGVALAAHALVGVGSPAPREYPSLGERILPTGTRLLSLRVADPAGGPPWGMRLIFTTADRAADAAHRGAAHWGCVQIGRIVDGQLGVLGEDGAFHDDGLFHALPIQPESCGSLSRSGELVGLTGSSNIETASAYQGLDGCVTETTRRQQAIALPSIERQLAIARAEGDEQGIRAAREGLASYRRIAPQVNAEPTCPTAGLRRIYYGIAGPYARSVTVTGPGVKETIPVSPANDGAYLVVQRRPELQNVLSALKTENFALFALALHRTVHYVNGRSCQEESPPECLGPLGSLRVGHAQRRITAPTPAPETALSRRAERNPSTSNPVTVTPRRGGPHTPFTLSFRSLLGGGGYSYRILGSGPERCQRAAEQATGGDGVAIGGVPIVRGQTITKTLTPRARGLCPGSYRIYVAYSDPERDSLENFPFATVRFTVVGRQQTRLGGRGA